MKNNRRGSVLILAFWALIILIFMGLGITRRVNAELSLVKHQLGKTRSRYAAFAGLFYVLDQIRQDLNNQETGAVDTLFNCGIVLEDGKTPQDIFAQKNIGEAAFDVKISDDPQRFGLEDETGKININGLTGRNYRILKELLMIFDVSEDDAEIITASVIDWKDQNENIFQEDLGAEQEYYQHLARPYDCKNNYFESLEELFLVRGMTQDIFQKIRLHLTVFPYQGTLRVNFNTASEKVLLALAKSVIGAATNTNELDAQSFVQRVAEFRNGSDGEWGTDDDLSVVLGGLPFSGPEFAIAAALMSIQSPQAGFIRAHIEGSDKLSRVKTFLDAVIQTDGLRVVSLNIQ